MYTKEYIYIYITCIILKSIPINILWRCDELVVFYIFYDIIRPEYITIKPVCHREVDAFLIFPKYYSIGWTFQINEHIKLRCLPPPWHFIYLVTVKKNRVVILHIQIVPIVKDFTLIDRTIAKNIAVSEIKIFIAEERIPSKDSFYTSFSICLYPNDYILFRNYLERYIVSGWEIKAHCQNCYHN